MKEIVDTFGRGLSVEDVEPRVDRTERDDIG